MSDQSPVSPSPDTSYINQQANKWTAGNTCIQLQLSVGWIQPAKKQGRTVQTSNHSGKCNHLFDFPGPIVKPFYRYGLLLRISEHHEALHPSQAPGNFQSPSSQLLLDPSKRPLRPFQTHLHKKIWAVRLSQSVGQARMATRSAPKLRYNSVRPISFPAHQKPGLVETAARLRH